MLYPLIRPIARWALSVFFRKLYIHGEENIPQGKPFILASNHPSAFLEPCIYACWMDVPLYFSVRGDYFDKPLANWALRDMHMIPYYRVGNSGYADLRKNVESLEESKQVLLKGNVFLFFAEGHTVHEKRLRPIQKGVARLALDTLVANPDLDLSILPVGVNYTYADRFRSEAMVEFGEPIPVAPYLEAYRQNRNKVVVSLTEELERRLARQLIIIADPADDALAEELFVLYRNQKRSPFWPVTLYNDNRLLRKEKDLAGWISSQDPAEKAAWKEKVQAYLDAVTARRVSDFGLMQPREGDRSDFLFLVAGFLPFAIGYGWNLPPLLLAKYIGYKRVARKEFHASVALGTGMGAYFLWFVVWVLSAGLVGNWKEALAAAIGMPSLGIFSLYYLEEYHKWKLAAPANKLPAKVREELLEKRASLVKDLEAASGILFN